MKYLKSKSYIPYVILLGVIIVPLLYSYFYLGAFWDPYAKLNNVPVAVVNNDTGATINKENRNLGKEMCDKLKEDGSLKFVFTDAKTAKDGLEGNDYYAVITIPSNFSSDVASASEETKQVANITFTSNEKSNYLATQILNNAVSQVEKSIRSDVNKEIVTELASQLNEVPNQMTELLDGLTTLNNGASDLSDGTSTLSLGASDLTDGATTLSDGTAVLKDGIASLQDGALDLQDGAKQLLDGSKTLTSGLTTYEGKLKEFASGLDNATSGSKSLSSNMSSLTSGIDQLLTGATNLEKATNSLSSLTDGAANLSLGANALNSGITSYTDGVNSLLANVSDVTSTLAAYAKATGDPTISAIVAQLTSQENLQNIQALQAAGTELKNGSSSLKDGSSQLASGTKNLPALKEGITALKQGLEDAKDGSTALSTGATTLYEGMQSLLDASGKITTATSDLQTGAASLTDGLNTLNSGIASLSDGTKDLYNGANQVNDGANALKDGTVTLYDGTNALQDGATKLADGVSTAKDSVASSITDANSKLSSLDGLDNFASDPVSVTTTPYAAVPNYGTAFAPYFMSLSLWVGGLMIFFGVYFDPDSRFKVLSRYSEKPILRTFAYLLIGLIQAILLCIVLMVGLGLKVSNLPLYFASCCLVSLVFISIIQLLLLFFSNVGKFLAILLLILQLTSCGGTFPMETVPKIFNVLYPFMPMTYSVGIFKEAISGTGDTTYIYYHGGILIAILVVILTSTLVLARAKKVKQLSLQE